MIKSNPAILIVEDSDEDYEAVIWAFKKTSLDNPIFRCTNGDDCLDFLFRKWKYTDPKNSPCPGIILLDLNLPGIDGRDVLKKIKNNQSLKKIPIIILTTSNDVRDIEDCYKNGSSGYIQKPIKLADLVDAIKSLKEYWFKTVILSI